MVSKNSLVLYKSSPALILGTGDKLEIATDDGKKIKVRPKDVVLLHPGPLASLSELTACRGELEEAWELLAGSRTNLAELAELIYEVFTPATAWATWAYVADGLYFSGTPEAIDVRAEEQVAELREAREAKERDQQAWSAFMARIHKNTWLEEDRERLASVVDLARGRGQSSKVLKELGRSTTAEVAHALLLKLKYWKPEENPYPYRYELPEGSAAFALPDIPEEPRTDLTHLSAFAIDDEGNTDPDDAISLDGDRIWVHVADVAALVPPDSEADLEARGRGANSYLPEQTRTMLPAKATTLLGLGLQEISPALSFGVRLDEQGEIHEDIEVVTSWVKVTRMTYAEAEAQLNESPLAEMAGVIDRFHQRRKRLGAAMLSLPEAKIKVSDGEILIRPLQRHASREMVTDAMLMAGEAAARYATARGVPIPYATQDPPDSAREPEDMAAMFAYRKQFKRTRMATSAGLHAGLGLPMYTRATSPLRRYLDLVVHQQLRAVLRGETPLSEEEVLARLGASDAVSGSVRGAERAANRHWTLVYLNRFPQWTGQGVLVDKRRGKGVLIIPELALETQVTLDGDPPLNALFTLANPRVDLPNLSTSFKVTAVEEPAAD